MGTVAHHVSVPIPYHEEEAVLLIEAVWTVAQHRPGIFEDEEVVRTEGLTFDGELVLEIARELEEVPGLGVLADHPHDRLMDAPEAHRNAHIVRFVVP